MPMFELDFKIRHACNLGNISSDFPSIKILKWCNNGREVIELVGGTEKDYSRVVKTISEITDVIEEMSDGHKVHLITRTCSCGIEDLVGKSVEETGLLPILPIVFRKGWEYHRIIALRHDDINALLEQFKDQSFFPVVLRKVVFNGFSGSSMTFTADTLFSDLTEKQMDALLTAYRHGYYKLPRDSDIQTIAAERRVARTTFQEHLKKAENKLVSSLAPHIHAWFHLHGGKGQQINEWSH
ncbi:MAG: helix-turn-helix domain-containing protein [Candidatus Thorarchaeota archaeon]|nr:MAG: helix-turn-helix domain-containing protein [Candidatus Thorarchaeota archaeon]